jgi:DNA-binding FrmR family transcriptional regulator
MGYWGPSAASLPEPRRPRWTNLGGLRRDTPGGYDAGMATTTGRRPAPAPDPAHFRHSYAKDTAQLMRRLSRMEGQVRGIARMIEREEYCVDILQQTAALRAAVDALSIIVLEDHVQGCVRTAAERGEADQYVDEVIDVVRRTLGRPVRSGSRTT